MRYRRVELFDAANGERVPRESIGRHRPTLDQLGSRKPHSSPMVLNPQERGYRCVVANTADIGVGALGVSGGRTSFRWLESL